MAIADKVGAPNKVDRDSPDNVRVVFHKKNFNPDDSNRVDQTTVVILKHDAGGKLVAKDLEFL